MAHIFIFTVTVPIIFLANNRFHKTAKNFNLGSVRRLLTLGTPHLGSGLANLLTRNDQPIGACIRRERLVVHDERRFGGFDVDENGDVEVTVIRAIAEGQSMTESEIDAGYEILESGLWYIQSVENLLENPPDIPFVDPIPARQVAGAIDFLAVESVELNRLNASSQEVVTAGFVGNIGVRLGLDGGIGDAAVRAVTYTGCSVGEIFNNEETDGIVPLSSARGRLGTATTEERGVTHLGMGKQVGGTDVVDWVLDTLQGGRDRFSETASFDRDSLVPDVIDGPKKKKSFFERLAYLNTSGIFSLLGINAAYGDEAPELMLTVSDLNPLPGGEVTFELTSSVGEIDVATLTSQKGDLDDSSAPYRWAIDIPNSASGSYWYYATAFLDNQLVRSNSVVIDVTPPTSGLRDLIFEPGERVVMYPGATEQLVIIGRYSDGFNRMLTTASSGTLYSENIVDGLTTTPGNSPVFSVSSDGVIAALRPGEAEVVATNSDVSVSRRILVVPASDTDADGDGLSDADEEQFGFDMYNPDTDNDGIWDNIEHEESQVEPTTPPLDDPATADEQVGSSGGGCVIKPGAVFDPAILIILFGSLGYLYRRKRSGCR